MRRRGCCVSHESNRMPGPDQSLDRPLATRQSRLGPTVDLLPPPSGRAAPPAAGHPPKHTDLTPFGIAPIRLHRAETGRTLNTLHRTKRILSAELRGVKRSTAVAVQGDRDRRLRDLPGLP